MKPHVVAAVFARGGSKGLPRKNARLLAGKPLIGWSIDTARGSRLVDRVVVSTDDEEIAEIARGYGAEVPFLRPPELATDQAPEWKAWQHLVRFLAATPGFEPVDVLVSVPATAPLRLSDDIDACITRLVNSDADVVLTVTPSHANPAFNMVVLDETDTARIVMPMQGVYRRQGAPAVYTITGGVYATRPSFVLASTGVFDGNVKACLVPAERAIDVDGELDFVFAECLMTRRLNGEAPDR